GQVWRLLSYMFMHDPNNTLHLFFNMLALGMFGGEIEELWGTKKFVLFYCAAGVGSACLSIPLWNASVLGASGAILALLTVYAFYFPDRTILMFFVFPLPVRWAVVIIGVISLLLGIRGNVGGVAHITHLGGIVVALAYLKGWPWIKKQLSLYRKPHLAIYKSPGTPPEKDGEYEMVDTLLAKISAQGIDSLTPQERKLLTRYAQSRKKQG
ncbi:MAG: rhomboid family intramembrane serine protease, partial [Chitinivibrionales bacterium]|nr:rhomboid family intramembrane serine protease [Chitinivibrionales bacterium]